MHAMRKTADTVRVFIICFVVLSCAAISVIPQQKNASVTGTSAEGWSSYGGDAGGMRFSSASQIARDNVAQLKVAWEFHTGASQKETNLIRKAAFEATPILFENKLFLTSPYNQVFALN